MDTDKVTRLSSELAAAVSKHQDALRRENQYRSALHKAEDETRRLGGEANRAREELFEAVCSDVQFVPLIESIS